MQITRTCAKYSSLLFVLIAATACTGQVGTRSDYRECDRFKGSTNPVDLQTCLARVAIREGDSYRLRILFSPPNLLEINEIQKDNDTWLGYASEQFAQATTYGDKEKRAASIKTLFDLKADPNIPRVWHQPDVLAQDFPIFSIGFYARTDADSKYHQAVFSYFMDAHQDPNAVRYLPLYQHDPITVLAHGDSILSLLAVNVCGQDKSPEYAFGAMSQLLKLGADSNLADSVNGQTALMSTSWRGCVKASQALIDAGARLETQDHRGRRAIDWSSMSTNNLTKPNLEFRCTTIDSHTLDPVADKHRNAELLLKLGSKPSTVSGDWIDCRPRPND
jgi:hypothetical protein